MPKFGVTSAGAALMWNNGAYDFWGRSSIMRKTFGTGFTYRMNKSTTVSSEVVYDA